MLVGNSIAEMFFAFFPLPFPPLNILILVVEPAYIAVVLFFYLVQVSYQDCILLLQKHIPVCQFSPCFRLVIGDSLYHFADVFILFSDYLLQLAVFSKDLFTYPHRIRELSFHNCQLFPQEDILFLEP